VGLSVMNNSKLVEVASLLCELARVEPAALRASNLSVCADMNFKTRHSRFAIQSSAVCDSSFSTNLFIMHLVIISLSQVEPLVRE
jgi:hypothetical protein